MSNIKLPEADADGWMPWSGSKNPLGQAIVSVRLATGAEVTKRADHFPEVAWSNIITHVRLAPTAPVEASGSERDIRGETFMGFRVAAWRYRQGDETEKLPHHYAEHWSTPGASAWGIQRLFTEDQLQQALNLRPQPSGETIEQRFPALNDHLIRMASSGSTGSLTEWGAFLECLRAALSTTPARAKAQDEGAAGERERIARIIDPCPFMNIGNTTLREEFGRGPKDREAAFAKADRIIDILRPEAPQPKPWEVVRAPDDDPDWPEAERMDCAVWLVKCPDGNWRGVLGVDEDDARVTAQEAYPDRNWPVRAHPSPTPAADADRVRIAVEALEEIAHLIKISPDVPSDDFDRGARAARFQAFDIANPALAALKSTAAKEGGEL